MFKSKSITLIITTILLSFTFQNMHHQPTVNAKTATDSNTDTIWERDGIDNRLEVQQLGPNNTIYYHIDTPKNNAYYKIWQKAVNNWNNLKIIHLKAVSNNDSRKEVTLNGTYQRMTTPKLKAYIKQHNINKYEDGTTLSNYNTGNNTPYPNYIYFSNTKATLLPVSWGESYNSILVVAQHELGHAIGFGHDTAIINGNPVIMNPNSSNVANPLGNHERQLLLKYYGPFLK